MFGGADVTCRPAPAAKIKGSYVYFRPHLASFLEFCLERFALGVWSSMMRHNVSGVMAKVLPGYEGRLAFFWDQSKSTDSACPDWSPDRRCTV